VLIYHASAWEYYGSLVVALVVIVAIRKRG
jgi:hypothetical protein